jgi:hypothetical protein
MKKPMQVTATLVHVMKLIQWQTRVLRAQQRAHSALPLHRSPSRLLSTPQPNPRVHKSRVWCCQDPRYHHRGVVCDQYTACYSWRTHPRQHHRERQWALVESLIWYIWYERLQWRTAIQGKAHAEEFVQGARERRKHTSTCA